MQAAGGAVREHFAGVEVEVLYDAARAEFTVRVPNPVEVIEGYWFARMAFHPESTVFEAPLIETDAAEE